MLSRRAFDSHGVHHARVAWQGLGRAITAACWQRLMRSVDVIGLNVKADNEAAIPCYESLGFERAGDYVEGAASMRPRSTARP